MKKKYYKVLSDGLTSAVTEFPLKVKYTLNEWVRPNIPGSHLFVFDSLQKAKNFCGHSSKDIYECEVKNPQKLGVFMDYFVLTKDILCEILKLKNNKKKYRHKIVDIEPLGTVFCSAVKLTKRVI